MSVSLALALMVHVAMILMAMYVTASKDGRVICVMKVTFILKYFHL